jgi:hypothetical protein
MYKKFTNNNFIKIDKNKLEKLYSIYFYIKEKIKIEKHEIFHITICA